MSEEIRQRILSEMDKSIFSCERNMIRKIYKNPEKYPQKILDGLILVIHERNILEERAHQDGKLSKDDLQKLELCNGEIRGILYCLGLDVRL